MRYTLWLAGAYNILWGVFALLFPLVPFHLAGIAAPNYPELWQCIGMIVGVYGFAYIAAGFDPIRHWPVVLAGLLGKVFGPIGFARAAWQGHLPWQLGWTILANDLVWWIPFGMILSAAYVAAIHTVRRVAPEIQKMALRVRSQHGSSLLELSEQTPLLVVFLRHPGCTFCREALADIASQRAEIDSAGTTIALVHMSGGEQARKMLERYGLAGLHHVSDPQKSLYRAFGLSRGNLSQIFGPWVWWRGFQAGVLRGHGIGPIQGDGFQMPGVFLIFHGEVVRSFVHHSAADRPDYAELAGARTPQPV